MNGHSTLFASSVKALVGKPKSLLVTSVTSFGMCLVDSKVMLNQSFYLKHMSRIVRKPVFSDSWTKSDTNKAVRPQKMAGGLKFQI